MSWPTMAQFSTMMQNPAVAFRDAELKRVTIEKDGIGQPRPRSGAFAVVYRALFPNQESMAVRVFSSDIPARRERYKTIHEHLSRQSLKCLVPFTYSDDGFRAADGKWYPLVTMDWVKGVTLFDWLQSRADSSAGRNIDALAEQWREIVQQLGQAQIAHGDLQHANVMVTNSEEIRLVDYDGMCVPDLIGLRNEEIGVEPYQHPQRNGNTELTLSLDNFSSIFIYLGLKSLAAEPRLWADFVVRPEYDKILFRKEDFSNPSQSPLFNRLQRSPDSEVQRLANRLCELWRADIDEVPPLSEVLFSFDQISVLLDKKDFDEAVALLSRNKKHPQDAPSHLQPLVLEAQQRVSKRAELEAAVKSGDETRMAVIAGSPLLQGYPLAKESLAAAADAASVAKAIQKLETAKVAKNWREFVSAWDAALAVFKRPTGKLRKSVAGYEAQVTSWREKNHLCDRFLAGLQHPEPDASMLADLWKKLFERGGHPESDGHQQTIDLLVRRDHAWKSLQRVPVAQTESADKALTAAWDEQLFAGWPRAEGVRERLDQAKTRLHDLANFMSGTNGAVTFQGEQHVLTLAQDLPRDYSDAVRTRIVLAEQRLQANSALNNSLATDSDLKIARAFRDLKNVEAATLVAPKDQPRIQLACDREPVLVSLNKIPTSYTPSQATEWDKKLLALWNQQLLEGCRDAAAWTTAYQHAGHRQNRLQALSAAISSGDTLRGSKIVEDPCLQGYTFNTETTRWIESARTDARSIKGMMECVRSSDGRKFAEHFNARVVRSYASTLNGEWEKILGLVTSEVLPTERLGLAPPRGQRALELERHVSAQNSRRYTIKWNWPAVRFSDECHVMICRQRPAQRDTPDSIDCLLNFEMTREMYQAAGGLCRQSIPPAWQGSYVVVWAKINLGSTLLWSEPLVLGKV